MNFSFLLLIMILLVINTNNVITFTKILPKVRNKIIMFTNININYPMYKNIDYK